MDGNGKRTQILKLVKSDNKCPCGISLGTRTTVNCRCCEWLLDHLIEFLFNNIGFQLNNNTILNEFDLIIMGGLIHTVANNKHRYQKSENVFSDIVADIYLTQMRNLVKVRLMSQNRTILDSYKSIHPRQCITSWAPHFYGLFSQRFTPSMATLLPRNIQRWVKHN